MKDNSADKKIAEQMNGLDTLGAGIVYGGEEAWDKLQGRMDASAAKTVRRRYAIAAAVLLLVMGGIYTWINTDKEVPAVVSVPAVHRVKTPEHNSIHSEGTVQQEIAAEFHLPVQKSPVLKLIAHPVSPLPVVLVREMPAGVAAQTLLQLPETQQPVAKEMKVISINDVERGSLVAQRTQKDAEGIALDSLPIVHIREVEREARDIKAILQENRFSIGHIPFIKQSYEEEYYFNRDSYHQPVKFLKPRNTQN